LVSEENLTQVKSDPRQDRLQERPAHVMDFARRYSLNGETMDGDRVIQLPLGFFVQLQPLQGALRLGNDERGPLQVEMRERRMRPLPHQDKAPDRHPLSHNRNAE